MGVVPEQNQDIPCDTRKRVNELITSPGTDVTNLTFPNDYVAYISWKYSEENVSTRKNVNFAVAVDSP